MSGDEALLVMQGPSGTCTAPHWMPDQVLVAPASWGLCSHVGQFLCAGLASLLSLSAPQNGIAKGCGVELCFVR